MDRPIPYLYVSFCKFVLFGHRVEYALRRFARRHVELLAGRRTWRRLVGGRWECWYLDLPWAGDQWFWIGDIPECLGYAYPHERPHDLARGTPIIEEHFCDNVTKYGKRR